MIALYLEQLIQKRDLDEEQIQDFLKTLLSGTLHDAQIAGILVALRAKGETSHEIAFMAKFLRKFSQKLHLPFAVMDTCGTGGDGYQTFNISTTVAFVLAASGIKIAKHGNRSVSSRSGSADVLEHMGVHIDLSAQKVQQAIEEIGIGFLYAPQYHPAMKHVMPARNQLQIKTVFNILGPLLNPASAGMQMIGVYDEKLLQNVAQALVLLGTERSCVVHGGGLDELCLHTISSVCHIHDGMVENFTIDPRDFGIPFAEVSEILGGDPQENAHIMKNILIGRMQGPMRDIVVLNAALGLYIAQIVSSIVEGITVAQEILDQKLAWKKLQQLIAFAS